MPQGQPKIINIGQIFGKLTIIDKAPNIIGLKREYGAWQCRCECESTIIVASYQLNRGAVKSCGCLFEFGSKYKPGDQINRLTLKAYQNGKWLCQCRCGNFTTLATITISSGNTKSCGCLLDESRLEPERLAKLTNKKYEPIIASAQKVWRQYVYRDTNCDIDFEQFYVLSQMNCDYCGIEPFNTYNVFLKSVQRAGEASKKIGNFIYNGIDRIDNSKGHLLTNCVTCCKYCNRAKNDRTLLEYLQYISNLHILDLPQHYDLIDLPDNKYMLAAIRCIFRGDYNDGDITLQQFYSLSQLPCNYCQALPLQVHEHSNHSKNPSKEAIERGNFKYNGLDRIDSSLGHMWGNVAPCCYYCNFAKGKRSYQEFCEWIRRVTAYQKLNQATYTT